jgi:hypothetical protein
MKRGQLEVSVEYRAFASGPEMCQPTFMGFTIASRDDGFG